MKRVDPTLSCANGSGREGAMAKVQMQCPNCGGEVELGDIECRHCGVNLKSGETYETRVKQAKGKARHPEHFAARIYFGVGVAFVLCVFAGMMYQRAVEKTFEQGPELFEYPVRKMEEIDGLLHAAGQAEGKGEAEVARKGYKTARKRTEELITWIEQTERGIKLESLYSPTSALQNPRRYRATQPEQTDYNKRLAKRQLRNLKAKAEHMLEGIPQT
jgi:hypothetical protein